MLAELQRNKLKGPSTLARMDAWPKMYLNVFPLTLTLISTLTLSLKLILTLILKHKNVFEKRKWRHFSGKCPDTKIKTIGNG